jgi:hypothetical protein
MNTQPQLEESGSGASEPMTERHKQPIRFAVKIQMLITASALLVIVLHTLRHGDHLVAIGLACLILSGLPASFAQLRNPELEIRSLADLGPARVLQVVALFFLLLNLVLK